MLRRLASLAVAATVAFTGLAIAAPSAHASTEESQFVSLTNGARANKGLRGYTVSADLVAVARRHAQKMAADHTIYHNNNLGSDVSGWQAVGENVGMGGSASSIHQAFMNSAAHRANILDGDFTQVGIGTARDEKGVIYVTEVFRKPYGATAAAPAPKPAPRPVYRPAPRQTVARPVARTATSRPVARPAAKPVAKKPAARPADPGKALAARLAAARAVASRTSRSGAVDSAVAYLEVMRTLG